MADFFLHRDLCESALQHIPKMLGQTLDQLPDFFVFILIGQAGDRRDGIQKEMGPDLHLQIFDLRPAGFNLFLIGLNLQAPDFADHGFERMKQLHELQGIRLTLGNRILQLPLLHNFGRLHQLQNRLQHIPCQEPQHERDYNNRENGQENDAPLNQL
ncbi:hypothetical protein D3C75_771350 [compost metagenome]